MSQIKNTDYALSMPDNFDVTRCYLYFTRPNAVPDSMTSTQTVGCSSLAESHPPASATASTTDRFVRGGLVSPCSATVFRIPSGHISSGQVLQCALSGNTAWLTDDPSSRYMSDTFVKLRF